MLALRARAPERDRFRYEVLYKGMTIRQVIEQNPRQTIVRKILISSEIQRPPSNTIAFMQPCCAPFA